MITPAPTREIVNRLKNAGFSKRDGKGSHTVWTCRHRRYRVTVDTGHRSISPGVRRQVETEARELARELADRGVSIRDVGEALGVSFQRAQQLIAARTSERRGRV